MIELKPPLVKVCEYLGWTAEDFINTVLSKPLGFRVDFSPKLQQIQCTTVPGALWWWPDGVEATKRNKAGTYVGANPHKDCKLFVVCPHPAKDSSLYEQLPVSELKPIIDPILMCTGIAGDEVYCYYASPFYPPDGKVQSPYITAFSPFLRERVKDLQPECILVLGASGLKGLFGAKGMVKNFYGTTDAEYEGIPVYYTVDPFKLLTNPKTHITMENDLSRIISKMGGTIPPWETDQSYKKYEMVETLPHLASVVGKLLSKLASQGYLRLGVDCEWGNRDGREGIEYDILRYVQFSSEPHTAYVVKLTDPELNSVYEEPELVTTLIKTLFEHDGVQLAGHNFKVDLLHLMKLGIDCRKNFVFDTMTAFHYAHPQAKIGLDEVALLYTDLGRYDLGLDNYLLNAKLKGHTKKHGYSRIPDEILFPYAAQDVDAVMQIWPKLELELARNKIGESYAGYEIDGLKMWTQLDVYLSVVKKADDGIFEPEYLGLPVNKDLMIQLHRLFIAKETEVRTYITEYVGWEHFDPDAPICRAYLYGRQYYTSKDAGKQLPEHVQPLNLTPVKTTGKYPENWEDLSEDKLKNATPAIDNDSLKILKERHAEHADILQLIIDYKALHQVVKNFLKSPDVNEETGEEVFVEGLIGKVDHDGCIRGTFLQTTETGRFRSLKPNLNNLSGNAELETRRQFALTPDFFKEEWEEMDTYELIEKGLLHPEYDILRAIVEAPPGYVILGKKYSSFREVLWGKLD